MELKNLFADIDFQSPYLYQAFTGMQDSYSSCKVRNLLEVPFSCKLTNSFRVMFVLPSSGQYSVMGKLLSHLNLIRSAVIATRKLCGLCGLNTENRVYSLPRQKGRGSVWWCCTDQKTLFCLLKRSFYSILTHIEMDRFQESLLFFAF